MIIHILAFVVIANLSSELRAGAFDENRYEEELASYPRGLSMYDGNGELVELTEERAAPSEVKGKIIFELYTKQRPTIAEELIVNDTSSLKKGGYDPSKPTYIITHGWRNNGSSPSCVLIRDAYLAKTDSNVIVVDWSSYSMSENYIDVANEVEGVGERVKLFIKWLYENGLKADDATLVGHSLGAHVVGLAGYQLTPQVNNIVGLDPALPMFSSADEKHALTKKDAKHVQIIHTSAGILGYLSPSGHSDFFPNGGGSQPGCTGDFVTWSACCHDRAYIYFAESLSNKSFVGTACESYEDYKDGKCGEHPQTAIMGGLDLTSVKPGTYYLRMGSQRFVTPGSNSNLQDGLLTNQQIAVQFTLWIRYRMYIELRPLRDIIKSHEVEKKN